MPWSLVRLNPYGIASVFCQNTDCSLVALRRQTLFSVLLLFSVVAVLLTPTASSQTHTTITSWTTETGWATKINGVGTTTVTSTLETTTDIQSLTVPARYPGHCGGIYFPVTFNAGDRLVGKLTSANIIDFYVMSTDQFNKFHNESYCVEQQIALVGVRNIATYSLDWVAPSDGDYYFLFLNMATQDVPVSISLQYPVSEKVTSTLYSTLSIWTTRSEYAQYVTQVSQNADLGLISAIALVAFILILGGLFFYRRSHVTPKTRK
jgi:hypothetical protein